MKGIRKGEKYYRNICYPGNHLKLFKRHYALFLGIMSQNRKFTKYHNYEDQLTKSNKLEKIFITI